MPQSSRTTPQRIPTDEPREASLIPSSWGEGEGEGIPNARIVPEAQPLSSQGEGLRVR